MNAEETIKKLKELVDKTDEDIHTFAIVATVDKNSLVAVNVCVKGNVTVVAQTLNQVINQHALLRNEMILDALASMAENNPENRTIN